ncbi:MAG TPA: HNH endonuclease signature motif containing protein [Ilumatobacter sp.]
MVPWECGGPTDLSNLGPLCTHDHHLVHEGGWTLSITPNRIATGHGPTAPIDHTGATIDRAPNGVARPPEPQALQLELVS